MWRFYSIISFITGIIFACSIRARRSWFNGAEEKYGGYCARVSLLNERPRLRYGIKLAPGNAQVVFKEEGLWDRVLKLFGICKEFQTDDREFDTKVFIMADDHIVLDMLRASPVLRQTIRELLSDKKAADILSISVSGEYAWVEISNESAAVFNDFVAAHVRQALIRIHGSLATNATPRSERNFRRYKVLQLCNIALLFCGTVVLYFLDKVDPVSLVSSRHITQLTVGTTACCIALYCVLIVWLFRRTTYAVLLLRDFALFGIFAVGVSSYLLYRSINIDFDRRGPAVRDVLVLSKTETSGYKRMYFVVDITDWESKSRWRRCVISPSVYRSLPERGPIRIKVHQGYFEDTWIEF
jgi:hypothetical protein